MSFFTYYGKLNDELFVVILPNGTIEVDDPVHLYTNKQFMSYRARDVSITDEGEDCITFHDGYYSFEVVSSKVYQALSLTRKAISSGETATVTLTRHYDQPQTSTPQADRPKIWTGTISFHDWAKNESFVVVAPQGLGNNKPVVAMWQWTKDSKDSLVRRQRAGLRRKHLRNFLLQAEWLLHIKLSSQSYHQGSQCHRQSPHQRRQGPGRACPGASE
jgi:hypothetical protein